MKYFAAFMLLVACAYAGIYFIPSSRQYAHTPQRELEEEYGKLHAELFQRDLNMTLPIGGFEVLKEMRKTERWMGFELTKRKYHLDQIIPGLTILIFGLLIASGVIRQAQASRLASKSKVKVDPFIQVPEATPREEYVDELEFRRRSEGGFKSREEAVRWLTQDPLLTCDYCGAKLKSTFLGDREALQLVTFYKKVPEGAKDLRIVLGSLWFTLAATELKCSGCQRVVRR